MNPSVHALLFVAACALGMFATKGAAAQEDPPAEPSPPAPEPPPPEPVPPPPQEAPPAEPPPKDPVITLEETPDEPPARPAPAPKITLEETPDEAPAKPRKRRRRHSTAPPAAVPPPTPPSQPSLPPASPEPSEPSPDAKGESGEPEPESKEPGDEKEKEEEDDGDGLFGPFRIGGLVGVGLPGVLSFGGMIKITRYLGAGLNVSLIPSVRLSYYGEAQLSYQEYDIYGRLFPFGGMVFVGAGVGYASVAGSLRTSFVIPPSVLGQLPPEQAAQVPNPLFVGSGGSVKTLVLTPTIGLLHTFGSGFTLGIDAGVQMPIAPSDVKFESHASVPEAIRRAYIEPNDRKVRETLETVGRTIIPTLNLRVGWLL